MSCILYFIPFLFFFVKLGLMITCYFPVKLFFFIYKSSCLLQGCRVRCTLIRKKLLSKSSILLDIIIIAVTKRNYEASLFPTSRVTRWREETTEHRIIQKFAIFQFLLSLKTRKSLKKRTKYKTTYSEYYNS